MRIYFLIMGGIWAVWLISWLVAALWASKAAQRPPLRDELPYRVLHVIGALLLIANFQLPRFSFGWSEPEWVAILLLCLEALGFAFAWWARIHLGKLWSGGVERMADHRVVDTGPYRLVRHPIYTGLIAGAVALAAIQAKPWAIAGAALFAIGFILKARVEERFLEKELGGYEAYRRRVSMIVPLPKFA